ncbi:MAG: prepilin peptidase [Patescibacteria group bacterium]|nr:prepilin peptidase [Patescibacteria group bacterium]
MNTLVFIFVFLLGMIIGSFLNVVIYRFNTGKSISKGRSVCMTCNKQLRWYELIPVFSFLIQSGRCRRCASNISHQYPLVEFITGLMFTLIVFHFYPVLFISQNSFILLVIFWSFIFSLLLVISVYDIRHKIIPDKLVYVFIVVSFIFLFINQTGVGPLIIQTSLSHIVAGPLFALPFALLWLLSKGRLMGLGDSKLILGIAWALSPLESFAALTLSFWIGSIVSLALIFFSRKKVGMKTEIPFAPFLVLSTFIVFFYSLDIFSLISLFHL